MRKTTTTIKEKQKATRHKSKTPKNFSVFVFVVFCVSNLRNSRRTSLRSGTATNVNSSIEFILAFVKEWNLFTIDYFEPSKSSRARVRTHTSTHETNNNSRALRSFVRVGWLIRFSIKLVRDRCGCVANHSKHHIQSAIWSQRVNTCEFRRIAFNLIANKRKKNHFKKRKEKKNREKNFMNGTPTSAV